MCGEVFMGFGTSVFTIYTERAGYGCSHCSIDNSTSHTCVMSEKNSTTLFVEQLGTVDISQAEL